METYDFRQHQAPASARIQAILDAHSIPARALHFPDEETAYFETEHEASQYKKIIAAIPGVYNVCKVMHAVFFSINEKQQPEWTEEIMSKHFTDIDPRWQKNSSQYECDCGATAKYPHILWANQHGFGKRVFCDACGQWTDIEYTSRGWSKHIVREGTGDR